MAYSKKKTATKGLIQALSVFLAGVLIQYVPGVEGIKEVALIGALSGLITALLNYLKKKNH